MDLEQGYRGLESERLIVPEDERFEVLRHLAAVGESRVHVREVNL